MKVYFTSFYPLCHTKEGLEAIEKHHLKPYRDGSCRLEPDFEKVFPSITGLCRPKFSKTLKVGDVIVYVTNKTRGEKHLIAILKVIHTVDTQLKAKQWYEDNNADLSQNLMLTPNQPIPLDQTSQKGVWDGLKKWDNAYKKRANDNPNVAICEKLYCELDTPHLFDDITQRNTFGKILSTQNYCGLSDKQWDDFKDFIATEKIVSIQEIKKW
jgi:hypothetical protein